jgi:hypothetical protein
VAGCGEDVAPRAAAAPAADALATAISAAIGGRLGAAVITRCPWPVPACFALLPDGSALTVHVDRRGDTATWRADGMVIATAPIEAYVRGALADLGVTTAAHCGPALRAMHPGERIACHLDTGGAAFVTVHGDGTLALELALDPAAAAARGDTVAPGADRELTAKSRALEASDDDD